MDMKVAKESLFGFAAIQTRLPWQDFDSWSGSTGRGPFRMIDFKVADIASRHEDHEYRYKARHVSCFGT